MNPIGERACYDEGKRVAETLMFDYYRQHKGTFCGQLMEASAHVDIIVLLLSYVILVF